MGNEFDIGCEGDGNPSALGAEDTAFDSRAPDKVAPALARRHIAAGRMIGPVNCPLWSLRLSAVTSPFRSAAGVRCVRLRGVDGTEGA
jgi:hypothetical protein